MAPGDKRARADGRHHRARADPLRGRPRGGLRRDPPGARLGAQPRPARHAADGDRHRPRRGVAARHRAAAGAARRLDRVGDRRRGDLRAAARFDAQATARAHARGRGRHERPGRGAARARLHRVDPPARLRRARHDAAVRPAARDRRGRRRARRLGRDQGVSRASTSPPAACIPWRRWRSSRSSFGAADVLHGSGFLAVYLAGLAMGSTALPAAPDRRPRSTTGWRGSRSSRCSSRSACS